MTTVDFTGTVSHGTMRTCDLVQSFWSILNRFSDPFEMLALEGELQEHCHVKHDRWPDDDDERWDSESMSWVLHETIWLMMEELSPKGHYFGSHPGDGADYGYWRIDPYDGCGNHIWAVVEHSHAGLVWECQECDVLSPVVVNKRPCMICGWDADCEYNYHYCKDCGGKQ